VLPCIDSISAQTQGSIRRITRLNYDARALTPGCSRTSQDGPEIVHVSMGFELVNFGAPAPGHP
jgi:hypothetical protein